jgi:dTDP-4-dehydrorhamnose reductase
MNGQKLVWLIGNKGMLGTELSGIMDANGIEHVGTDRDVDITNKEALLNFAQDKNIKWIVNCAAYTNVDKAEDDTAAAEALNVTGPANIALAANSIGAKLVHISTDYVFNGKSKAPYKEDDATDPIGVYGLTKRNGELEVLRYNAASYIIRTAWLYGKHGKNFVETILHLMNEQDEVRVVNDQRGSPTWARDLTEVIRRFISCTSVPYGIYHYTNAGEVSWFEFTSEIYRQGQELGLITKQCAIRPCTSEEYPAKVTRPRYSVLDKQKIQAVLGVKAQGWRESLGKYLCQRI